MWSPQVSALAREFRVVRYDHRGHGGSPVPDGPYSIDDLGRDVLELLDDLEIERASFCGLSIGGVVGLWLAAHAAARIDRLIVACSAPAFLPSSQWTQRAATVRADGVEAVADAVVSRWFTPSLRETQPDVVESYRAMLSATPREGYAGCCEALAAADLWPAVPGIQAATLVITGEMDPVVPPPTGEELSNGLANARHTVIAGAAHIANVEQPEVFTRTITSFLMEEPHDR